MEIDEKTDEIFTLMKSQIPALVRDYIIYVETAETAQLCTCEYVIHPDDVDKPVGQRRTRRIGAPAVDCMVHSREGLVMGFYTYVFLIRQGKAEFRERGPKPELKVVVQTTEERLTKLRDEGSKSIVDLDKEPHYECGWRWGPTLWDSDPKHAWCWYRRLRTDAPCNRRIHLVGEGYVCEGGHSIKNLEESRHTDVRKES